jgi:osmotically-inducible protein OsmY
VTTGAVWTIVLALAGCQVVQGSPADEQLQAAVVRALIDREDANLLETEVDVEDGVVYLSGEVRDHDRLLQAEAEARRVAGVKAVVSKLRIEP